VSKRQIAQFWSIKIKIKSKVIKKKKCNNKIKMIKQNGRLEELEQKKLSDN